jgi:hypothetical protein
MTQGECGARATLQNNNLAAVFTPVVALSSGVSDPTLPYNDPDQ